MRTTLDLDEDVLQETMRSTGARSKKKGVEAALREYVRMKRRQALLSRIGSWTDFDLTVENLEELRDEP